MTAPIEDGRDALGRGNLGGADGQLRKGGSGALRREDASPGSRSLRLHQAVLYFGKKLGKSRAGLQSLCQQGFKALGGGTWGQGQCWDSMGSEGFSSLSNSMLL